MREGNIVSARRACAHAANANAEAIKEAIMQGLTDPCAHFMDCRTRDVTGLELPPGERACLMMFCLEHWHWGLDGRWVPPGRDFELLNRTDP